MYTLYNAQISWYRGGSIGTQLIDIDPKYLLTIHIDSIGPFISATLVLLLFSYSLLYYLFINRNPLSLSLSAFLAPMFLFIFGYGMYVSMRTNEEVIFWTRICYTGVALAPIAFHYFVENIVEKKYTKLKWTHVVFSFIFLYFIWFDTQHMITDIVYVDRHPTTAKASGFIIFYGYTFVAGLVCFIILFKRFMQDTSFRRIAWPLIIGFLAWVANCLYAGLFGAILAICQPNIWIGTMIMTVMTSVFLGLQEHNLRIQLNLTITEKEHMYEKVAYDSLTGTFSRNYVLQMLERELLMSERNLREDVLIFIDADNFKAINDNYGHAIGDEVLKGLGKILLDNIEKTDIPARLGGDEFIVLLFNCSEAAAITLSKALLLKFEERSREILGDKHNYNLGLSIGIVSSKYWAEEAYVVIEKADKAMYVSKKSGKNKISVYREADILNI